MFQTFTGTVGVAASLTFAQPKTTIVYGSGSRVAQTDYEYDGSALTSVTAASHDETYYPAAVTVRGNLTKVTADCFPLPPATQTCSDASTLFTYDQTGQVLTKTDPLTNLTQYSYTDDFDSPPSMATNAYLTKITDPLN